MHEVVVQFNRRSRSIPYVFGLLEWISGAEYKKPINIRSSKLNRKKSTVVFVCDFIFIDAFSACSPIYLHVKTKCFVTRHSTTSNLRAHQLTFHHTCQLAEESGELQLATAEEWEGWPTLVLMHGTHCVMTPQLTQAKNDAICDVWLPSRGQYV